MQMNKYLEEKSKNIIEKSYIITIYIVAAFIVLLSACDLPLLHILDNKYWKRVEQR
jgi:hypothetical protein